MEPTNPYAPPMAEVATSLGAPSNAEAIRREHINHEASLKALGLLYLLSAVGTLVAGAILVIAGVSGTGDEDLVFSLGIGTLMIVLTGAYFWVGSGLRRLDNKVKTGATILAAFGMLSVPFGTLFGAYLLYLMHGKKGKVVLSDEYAAIVAATPHVKRKTSPIVWVFVGVLVLVVVGAFLAAVFA